ncbi:MAG: hypothetical protein DBY23_02615 [Bacillota bacterium]|nr:MAG: hypothetical protein DBY23_02615 [Bacillota bacterium]
MMKQWGFRNKLILGFGVLVAIVGIVLTVGLNYYFTSTYKTRAQQHMYEVSSMAEESYEIKIQKIKRITQDILSNSSIQSNLKRLNREQMTPYKKNIIENQVKKILSEQILFEEHISSLSVTSKTDLTISVSKSVLGHRKSTFLTEELNKANGSLLWSQVSDDSQRVEASRAILDLETMTPIGYVTIMCEKEYFGNLLNDISGMNASLGFLVDQEGTVICSNAAEAGILPENILKTDKEIVSHNGQDYYLYVGKEMDNSWTLVMLLSAALIEGELGDIRGILILITVVCVAAGIFMIIVITGHMTRPLRDLRDGMESMVAADFATRIEVKNQDELGRLGLQFNHMAESIENLIDQVYQMGILQKEAEIELLKMQINPHFLYNTLDVINWMARTGMQEEIVEVTTALAYLLRAAIKQGNFVTVEEEMTSVKNYLYIQKYRFGEKIQVEYQIDNELMRYIIPNFILQPLVENAIIHGLEPKIETGMLRITLKMCDGMLFGSVLDDGVGMSEEQIQEIYEMSENKDYRNHIGVRNVLLRLKNYYNGQAVLKIWSSVNKGTEVKFTIPLDLLTAKKE